MLTLSVTSGEWIKIGGALVYLTIKGGRIKVAIDAPREIEVEREGAKKVKAA